MESEEIKAFDFLNKDFDLAIELLDEDQPRDGHSRQQGHFGAISVRLSCLLRCMQTYSEV
jgi:hypothetical protein